MRAAWQKARQAARSPAEATSPLASRPYDLRHAFLSTWLNAGVAPLTDSEQTALNRIRQAEAEPD
jgi:hypothetical protein